MGEGHKTPGIWGALFRSWGALPSRQLCLFTHPEMLQSPPELMVFHCTGMTEHYLTLGDQTHLQPLPFPQRSPRGWELQPSNHMIGSADTQPSSYKRHLISIGSGLLARASEDHSHSGSWQSIRGSVLETRKDIRYGVSCFYALEQVLYQIYDLHWFFSISGLCFYFVKKFK